MDEQVELLREMRDLLRLIAEPALAKRDAERRTALREIAGRSKPRVKAICLMNGETTRAEIGKKSGLDSGNLSRLVQALRKKDLVTSEEPPRLVLVIPADFFEEAGTK